MLLKEPLFYYENLRKKFKNSYLAEDKTQAIIGIDCYYIDANEYNLTSLKEYFDICAKDSKAPFAGLFGVFAYEGVHYFEEIYEHEKSAYEFPKFIYANARAYLHFDKMSKIYTFYGDETKYYKFLETLEAQNEPTKDRFYQILTDLDAEKKHFIDIVKAAKEYIKSGDIFQVVLSKQLQIRSNLDSFEFYKKLSVANPSPYMFHFATPYGDVVGSSPELVFEMKSEQIFVAPIAGTRARGIDANEDERLKNELLNDTKELSEHKMLIDLARNDIGRVARSKSVVVKNPLHIQYYESVMHIVSEVYGKLALNLNAFDVLASIFPAGTLSGTPKIRAMQIISELEDQKRNVYGGGIGFLHFNGDVQMAILIRSAVFVSVDDDKFDVFVGAGAGIVYDSVPESEYTEICHKRASVVNVFKKNSKEIK
ncbi:anthranilate synthase component I family protein [Campylobacter sp. faydin G-105]|uniref:anthranilate synthase component I family protein n=1 Tax=Campylobacter anatolicus TaxID=2829105 RepID=UPI001BA122B0|nr:anthranilate synthase component I family protein [Campylobacter anatolicus]MBR8461824.1 anthranilate synthase component I family protein [Campylobacter anatolicus]